MADSLRNGTRRLRYASPVRRGLRRTSAAGVDIRWFRYLNRPEGTQTPLLFFSRNRASVDYHRSPTITASTDAVSDNFDNGFGLVAVGSFLNSGLMVDLSQQGRPAYAATWNAGLLLHQDFRVRLEGTRCRSHFRVLLTVISAGDAEGYDRRAINAPSLNLERQGRRMQDIFMRPNRQAMPE